VEIKPRGGALVQTKISEAVEQVVAMIKA
jgi:hypothetical protein